MTQIVVGKFNLIMSNDISISIGYHVSSKGISAKGCILITLYNSLASPYLMYCSKVWGHHTSITALKDNSTSEKKGSHDLYINKSMYFIDTFTDIYEHENLLQCLGAMFINQWNAQVKYKAL